MRATLTAVIHSNVTLTCATPRQSVGHILLYLGTFDPYLYVALTRSLPAFPSFITSPAPSSVRRRQGQLYCTRFPFPTLRVSVLDSTN